MKVMNGFDNILSIMGEATTKMKLSGSEIRSGERGNLLVLEGDKLDVCLTGPNNELITSRFSKCN